jgi:hypothetical protein
MKRILIVLAAVLFSGPALAACPNLTTLMNGMAADANQVMANFNIVLNCANGAVQLNGVNAWTAGQSSTPVALTSGSTITPNFSSGNIFTVILTGNATLANPSNLVAGQCGQIFIIQDGTGSRTLSYGTQGDAIGVVQKITGGMSGGFGVVSDPDPPQYTQITIVPPN